MVTLIGPITVTLTVTLVETLVESLVESLIPTLTVSSMPCRLSGRRDHPCSHGGRACLPAQGTGITMFLTDSECFFIITFLGEWF